MNGTENRSVSESLQLVPPGKDADLDLNQSLDCVEIMRPSSNPNAGRRLSRKTLAIWPVPVASLTDLVHTLSIFCELTNSCCTVWCRLLLLLIGTCCQNHAPGGVAAGAKLSKISWPQKMPHRFGQALTPTSVPRLNGRIGIGRSGHGVRSPVRKRHPLSGTGFHVRSARHES